MKMKMSVHGDLLQLDIHMQAKAVRKVQVNSGGQTTGISLMSITGLHCRFEQFCGSTHKG